jgi:hypothetical protein
MLRQLAPLPAAVQAAELNRVLAEYDPALPAALRKVANELRHAKRMSVKAAMHEALARCLADGAITKIKNIGARAAAGDQNAASSLSGFGLGGLGNAGTVATDLTRGLVCSAEVQRAITDLVGRNEGATGASLTALGFAVAQLAAQCPRAPEAPPPPPPPPPPPKPSLAVPLAIAGAAVLVVGAIAFAARAKKQ